MAGFRRSAQEQRLMAMYGVTTRVALVRKVRDEYSEETGEVFTVREAAVIVDSLLESTYQMIEGGKFDRQVEQFHDAVAAGMTPKAAVAAIHEFDADAAYELHLENAGVE